jgi:glycosyltransferase involved in cell wall biosynthesis
MSQLAPPPLVSVGIPTFDNPDGLRRTLRCITAQTYRHLEILVSDNGSPGPETAAVVRDFQRRDPRIGFHRQPANLGPEANFKFVLRQAHGDFFLWAADDDEWSPDFVAVCLAHIGSAGSAMTGAAVLYRPTGKRVAHPPFLISARRTCFENAAAFLNNLQSSLFYGLHRTATVRRVLGERFFDFYDFFFILRQILTHGYEVVPGAHLTVGVDTAEYVPKPYARRRGALFCYWPFLSRAAGAVLRSCRLSGWEKARLLVLVGYATANQLVYYERPYRPGLTQLVALGLRVLRRLNRWLLRLPLPPPLG